MKGKKSKTSLMTVALFYSIHDGGPFLKGPTLNTCTGIKFQYINLGGCIQTMHIHATTHIYIYKHTHTLFVLFSRDL